MLYKTMHMIYIADFIQDTVIFIFGAIKIYTVI